MADATATLGIQVSTQGVTQASQELDKLDKSAKNVAQSSQQLAPQTSATARAFRDMDSAAGSAATATERTATATLRATEGMRGLGPVATAALYGLKGFLAALVPGGLLAFERTAEAISALKSNLEGLVPGSGSKIFAGILEISQKTGASVTDLTGSFEALARAQRQAQASGNFVFTNLADQADRSSGAILKLQSTLTSALEAYNVSGKQLTGVSNALKSIASAGGLTKATFDQIENASSRAGAFVAAAFGYQGPIAIEKFRQQLDRARIPLDQFINTVGGFNSVIAQTSGGASTMAGAIGRMSANWDIFVNRVMGSSIVVTALNKIADGLTRVNELLKNPQMASTMSGALAGATAGFLGGAVVGGPVGAVIGGIGGAVVGGAVGGAFFTSPSGATSSLGEGNAFAPPPNSISPGTTLPKNFTGTPMFNVPDTFMGEEFVGAFASGGSFMVGGSGSTDSRRISMAVTPGERVTVTPPATNSTPVGGRGAVQNFNFVFPNATPQSFIQSSSQVRRAARQALA